MGSDNGTDDPRVGQLLGQAVQDPMSAKAIIFGFPTDEGVRRNGGRPGAASGPAAIRSHLHRLTPDARLGHLHLELLKHTLDLGDLVITGDLEADQAALARRLAPWLRHGVFVLVLGGGHETAFGHFLGYAEAGLKVGLLNWDAHADVRPLKEGRGHSGSPFRQALEHPAGACLGYQVHGLQPASVAASHLDYLRQRGCSFSWAEEIHGSTVERIISGVQAPTAVSFDLDAADAAAAPGVSAPSVAGLSVPLWLQAARAAGRCSTVLSADLVELNPLHDPDGRTARLAARTAWEILAGVAERTPN